ncbi:MAG: DNA adenine methylase, partial [Pseudomonadota bacterium]
YLNRTCWNGLYRENKKGRFNVPIGTRQTVIFDTDNFEKWSTALAAAELTVLDFEDAIDFSMSGDFLFIDPPYSVKHNLNGFVKYNQKIFAWEDQVRLKQALRRASKRGVLFAITNADHASTRDLFGDIGNVETLFRQSSIAGDPRHRSSTSEMLVTNYKMG